MTSLFLCGLADILWKGVGDYCLAQKRALKWTWENELFFFFFLMFYEAHGEKTGHCNVWCSKSVFVEACIVTDFQNKNDGHIDDVRTRFGTNEMLYYHDNQIFSGSTQRF